MWVTGARPVQSETRRSVEAAALRAAWTGEGARPHTSLVVMR
jgi:hypothetical protein